MKDTLNKKAVNYFGKSQEYKNKIAHHYIIAFENYVPTLESFHRKAKEILTEIDKRLEDN
jgi:hypothetical protein